MPYIPPAVLNNTEFPVGNQKDVATAIKIIVEKWTRLYPLIPYFQVNYAPEAAADFTSGTPPATVKDWLWGEPTTQGNSGTFQQPHASLAADQDAPDTIQWKPAIPVNGFIRNLGSDRNAKPFGYDVGRPLRLVFAAAMLDTLLITVSRGDKFEWDGEEYEVQDFTFERGYWKNTNVILYVECQCNRRRLGS